MRFNECTYALEGTNLLPGPFCGKRLYRGNATMNTMTPQTLGKEMVTVLRPLVGDHTVNFMETGGTIVASSDPAWIGTYHSGAAEAAASRRVIRIRQDDLPPDSQKREGISLPVVKNGMVLGVVGIHGRPEDLEQYIRLVDACVELYLEQTLSSRQNQLVRHLRVDLLRRLLDDAAEAEDLAAAAREAGVEPQLPVRVMAIMPATNGEGRKHWFEQLTRLRNLLVSRTPVNERHDIAEVFDDMVMVCHHIQPGVDPVARSSEIHETLCRELNQPVSIGLGSECAEWRGAARAKREAIALARLADGKCLCIDSPEAEVTCLLQECLAQSASHLRVLEEKLRRGFGARHMARIMETIHAYCKADCSGGKAAADLGIHKNTMNYRMNKILALLGLENQNAFVREFFLRLLLLNHSSRK